MGEGVARVVATDRKGTWVRTLSEEIARMRTRLAAVLTELDHRRHNATDVKHLEREHAGAVAAGALVLAAIVATLVLKVRRRRQRRWAHQGVTLTDRARRLGRALGRVAHDPDRLAAQPPPRMLGIPLRSCASDVAAMRPRRAGMARIRVALPVFPALLRQMGRASTVVFTVATRRKGRHPEINEGQR